MEHPFKIGEIYENSNGTFTVLSLSPPKMQIQYTNGSKSIVNIGIQARIWDRIQTERALAEEDQKKAIMSGRSSVTFLGLEEGDFKDNVAGTTWRSRQGLGGAVSQQLSDISRNEFISIAIYRRPQLFVYTPELPMDNQKEGVKLPKFVVQLNTEAVFYGFYIEKSDKPMGSDWYWSRFISLLLDTTWQEKIENIMTEWELHWVLSFEESRGVSGEYKILREITLSPFAKSKEFPTFSTFLAYLQNLPSQQWCNLFIGKTMEKSKALEMKEKVSHPIAHTFNALAPIFFRLLKQ